MDPGPEEGVAAHLGHVLEVLQREALDQSEVVIVSRDRVSSNHGSPGTQP